MRVVTYQRTSTRDQFPENQSRELLLYATARKWVIQREYVDFGFSATDKKARPAFDELMRDARRRRFDCVLVTKLDRWSRNLKSLILSLDELTALGIAFVSLNEGIDGSTAAGKLQLNILGSFAAFESARISERVKSGLNRARANGVKLGRKRPKQATDEAIAALDGLSVRAAAAKLGVSKSFLQKVRMQRKSNQPSVVSLSDWPNETPTAKLNSRLSA
jgi:DNA invertase Pin-like site-specific DNA recombinase